MRTSAQEVILGNSVFLKCKPTKKITISHHYDLDNFSIFPLIEYVKSEYDNVLWSIDHYNYTNEFYLSTTVLSKFLNYMEYIALVIRNYCEKKYSIFFFFIF